MSLFFHLVPLIGVVATITLPSPPVIACDPNTTKVYGGSISLQLHPATHTDLVISNNLTPPQDFVSVGKQKLKAKDYQGAIAQFNQALIKNPHDLDALVERARAYYRLNDFPNAITDLDAVLQRNSNNPTFFFYRGIVYDDSGRKDKAIADYNRAIRLNPQYADAYVNRSASYNSLGEYDQAIANYNEAIRLNPQYAGAYYNRGHSYDELGEYDKANQDFQKSADLFQQQGNTQGYRNVINKLRESV